MGAISHGSTMIPPLLLRATRLPFCFVGRLFVFALNFLVCGGGLAGFVGFGGLRFLCGVLFGRCGFVRSSSKKHHKLR